MIPCPRSPWNIRLLQDLSSAEIIAGDVPWRREADAQQPRLRYGIIEVNASKWHVLCLSLSVFGLMSVGRRSVEHQNGSTFFVMLRLRYLKARQTFFDYLLYC